MATTTLSGHNNVSRKRLLITIPHSCPSVRLATHPRLLGPRTRQTLHDQLHRRRHRHPGRLPRRRHRRHRLLLPHRPDLPAQPTQILRRLLGLATRLLGYLLHPAGRQLRLLSLHLPAQLARPEAADGRVSGLDRGRGRVEQAVCECYGAVSDGAVVEGEAAVCDAVARNCAECRGHCGERVLRHGVLGAGGQVQQRILQRSRRCECPEMGAVPRHHRRSYGEVSAVCRRDDDQSVHDLGIIDPRRRKSTSPHLSNITIFL